MSDEEALLLEWLKAENARLRAALLWAVDEPAPSWPSQEIAETIAKAREQAGA